MEPFPREEVSETGLPYHSRIRAEYEAESSPEGTTCATRPHSRVLGSLLPSAEQ